AWQPLLVLLDAGEALTADPTAGRRGVRDRRRGDPDGRASGLGGGHTMRWSVMLAATLICLASPRGRGVPGAALGAENAPHLPIKSPLSPWGRGRGRGSSGAEPRARLAESASSI